MPITSLSSNFQVTVSWSGLASSPSNLRLASVFLLIPTFVICIFTCAAYGQLTAVTNSTSTPISGAGHDYIRLLSETVDPANGSVSLRLQAPVPPGRGLTIPFALAYDSNGVEFATSRTDLPYVSTWGSVQTPWSTGGWSYSLPVLSYLSLVTPLPQYHVVCQANTGFVFQDPSGGRHSLNIAHAITSDNSACSSFPEYYQEKDSGGDDYYQAALDGSGNAFATDADGTVYTFGNIGIQGGSTITSLLPNSIEDRNGNVVKFSGDGSGTFTQTDSLGRVAITASGFGKTGNTVAVAGISSPYAISWIPTALNFTSPYYNVTPQATGCTFTPSDSSSGGAAIGGIALPNGTNLVFATRALLAS